MIGRGADGVLVDFEKSAVEMLICMGSVVERSADGSFHLIRKKSAVENIDLYKIGDRKKCWRDFRLIWFDLIRGGPAVEKIDRYGAGDKKECWRSSIVLKSIVDFDAYEIIFIYSFHYSLSYFSFVEFIFFNCALIFSRFRRDWWWSISFDDFDTIYFQLFRKRKDDPQRWNKNHDCWSYACMSWNSGDVRLIS